MKTQKPPVMTYEVTPLDMKTLCVKVPYLGIVLYVNREDDPAKHGWSRTGEITDAESFVAWLTQRAGARKPRSAKRRMRGRGLAQPITLVDVRINAQPVLDEPVVVSSFADAAHALRSVYMLATQDASPLGDSRGSFGALIDERSLAAIRGAMASGRSGSFSRPEGGNVVHVSFQRGAPSNAVPYCRKTAEAEIAQLVRAQTLADARSFVRRASDLTR